MHRKQFLSLDHVRRGCQIALKADLGWLSLILSDDDFWVLDCWWSTADCLDLSGVCWFQPWCSFWLMVLEGPSGGGRHPLWPPHALHRLYATYQAVLTVAEFISKGFGDYCSLIPVGPSSGCCLLPWMDMAMPCSPWSSSSHAGWGTDMAELTGQLFIPHAYTSYSLFLLVVPCRK